MTSRASVGFTRIIKYLRPETKWDSPPQDPTDCERRRITNSNQIWSQRTTLSLLTCFVLNTWQYCLSSGWPGSRAAKAKRSDKQVEKDIRRRAWTMYISWKSSEFKLSSSRSRATCRYSQISYIKLNMVDNKYLTTQRLYQRIMDEL